MQSNDWRNRRAEIFKLKEAYRLRWYKETELLDVAQSLGVLDFEQTVVEFAESVRQVVVIKEKLYFSIIGAEVEAVESGEIGSCVAEIAHLGDTVRLECGLW